MPSEPRAYACILPVRLHAVESENYLQYARL